MRRVWQLTGRAGELQFIDAATRRSGARGVLLAGAAGVGKSRLAREALARAESRGLATRWVSATASARGLPLGAFAAVLGPINGDPIHLLQQATDALLIGAGPQGVVLGVDDAHLLDELSAMLLHQLVLRGAVRAIVTVRSGEPVPDAVTALWKDSHLERLEVQPLSEPETSSLLEAVLGGPVDRTSANRLWNLCSGNALYLRQIVEGAVEEGRLHRVGEIWCWSGDLRLSPGLTELVHLRMGRLSDSVREVIDVLALAEPLGVGLVEHLTGSAALEQADAAGLITVDRSGQRIEARLAHPLYGEVRRAGMGQLRARRLRGSIATVLAAAGDRRVDDTLRRAALAAESDLSPDPFLLEAAAGMAIRLLDLSLAERLARAAVAAGAGFGARLTLANALSWLSRGAEADQELAALTVVAGNDLERVLAGFSKAANRFYTQRDPAGAEAVLAEAAATVADAETQKTFAAIRAAFEVHLGRPALAVRTAADALSSPTLPDLAVVMASFGFLGGLGMLGRADEMKAGTARAYAAGTGTSEAAVPCFGMGHLHIIGLRLAGYLTEAEQVAANLRRSGEKTLGPPQLYGLTLLGQAAFAAGRLQTATQFFREARAGLTRSDTSGFEAHCLLGLAESLAKTGEVAAAREALTELEEAWHPGLVYLQPERVLARAWIAAAEGVTTEAVALARKAAGLAHGRGQLAHEVLALQTAVCFGDRSVGGRLAELAGLVDGPRAPAAAAHAAALAADDGDALRDASERLEEFGDLLAAADAAAQAAVAYGRQGRNGAAQSAAVRANRLAAACEGARTPALRAAAKPLPLTEREREIVALAALGLANRVIADRLSVSVRTVEGHLYRAGAKLGTTDRAEFAALLRGD